MSEPEKKGFFKKIFEGLGKTRQNIADSVGNVLKSFTKLDEELYEELEEALILADMGAYTSERIIENLRKRAKEEKVTTGEELRDLLAAEISKILDENNEPLELPSPTVVLVIGVNGAGKTTSIGKLAHNYKEDGKSVMLAAADTFRAAAIDQLEVWAGRAGVPMIKHQEGSDPASVVFDAIQSAKARNVDILICDTAGRLQNKKNLMEELRKISRIIEREYPDAHRESFIVLDATTGQNAVVQAEAFNEIAEITGIILTKLDGTAKGGVVVSIKDKLSVPVRYIGVGEGIDDLQAFDSKSFSAALFDTGSSDVRPES